MRQLAFLTISILVSAPVPSLQAAPVSGRVEVLEKGNVKRAVVRDVLVYLEGVRADIPASVRERRVSIASRNKTFEPHVEVVPLGGSVSFPNHDDIMHNVFSLSKGNKFDLGLYRKGPGKSWTFKSAGPVRVFCNVHHSMVSYVYVADSPYVTSPAAELPSSSAAMDHVSPGYSGSDRSRASARAAPDSASQSACRPCCAPRCRSRVITAIRATCTTRKLVNRMHIIATTRIAPRRRLAGRGRCLRRCMTLVHD